MKQPPHIRPAVLTEQNRKSSVRTPNTDVQLKTADMTEGEHACIIHRVNLEQFAKSFLQGPLAKAMLERGEPLKLFVPVEFSGVTEWGGVDITIAGVTKELMDRSVRERDHRAARERGNGHSSNPHGALKPGDYGVHSHPDTANLRQYNSGDNYSSYQQQSLTGRASEHISDELESGRRRDIDAT